MIEEKGDLWKHPCPVKVITTNGDINRKGEAVMGRGVALQARAIVPGIERMLAAHIRARGNRVGIICKQRGLGGHILTIVSFPVKFHWQQDANLGLIRQSARQLDVLALEEKWPEVLMPRPGCGNGRLAWAEVKPVIDWLDDRFTIIDLEGK